MEIGHPEMEVTEDWNVLDNPVVVRKEGSGFSLDNLTCMDGLSDYTCQMGGNLEYRWNTNTVWTSRKLRNRLITRVHTQRRTHGLQYRNPPPPPQYTWTGHLCIQKMEV